MTGVVVQENQGSDQPVNVKVANGQTWWFQAPRAGSREEIEEVGGSWLRFLGSCFGVELVWPRTFVLSSPSIVTVKLSSK